MGARKDKLKDDIDKMSHQGRKDLEKVVEKSKHSVKHTGKREEQDKDGGASI